MTPKYNNLTLTTTVVYFIFVGINSHAKQIFDYFAVIEKKSLSLFLLAQHNINTDGYTL